MPVRGLSCPPASGVVPSHTASVHAFETRKRPDVERTSARCLSELKSRTIGWRGGPWMLKGFISIKTRAER